MMIAGPALVPWQRLSLPIRPALTVDLPDTLHHTRAGALACSQAVVDQSRPPRSGELALHVTPRGHLRLVPGGRPSHRGSILGCVVHLTLSE